MALGVIAVLAGLAVVVIEAHLSTAGILGLVGVSAAAAGFGMIVAGSGAALFVLPGRVRVGHGGGESADPRAG